MSRESFKANVLANADADLRAWGERPIVLEMDITTALAVCGALQLSLRHPQFSQRPSANNIRQFVRGIEDQIPAEFPGIKKLISLGFHQRFDE